MQRWIWCVALVLYFGLVSSEVEAQIPGDPAQGIWSQRVVRDGFHFKFSFGGGVGPLNLGLWHSMEIGHTFSNNSFTNGWTLAYDHVFLLSPNDLSPNDGANMFGGHMVMLKIPLGIPEIVAKIAVGLGESVELREGFIPYFGFGWHYGIDFHFPLTTHSGFTIGINGVHSITAKHGHLFGFGMGVGYTWF